MNHVGFAAFLMNHANPAVVTPVRHSFVNGRVDQDCDLLSGLVCSEYPA
jgi:hypothetical protein